MKIFTIAGWSQSGKTTLVVKLVKEFKKKRQKVLTLKKIGHKYHLEPESKDSFLFLSAGSDEVYLVAKKEMMRITAIDSENEVFETIMERAGMVDVVLLEGFYRKGVPLIEVFDPVKNKEPKFPVDRLVAFVSPKTIYPTIPTFHPDDIAGILNFLENYR